MIRTLFVMLAKKDLGDPKLIEFLGIPIDLLISVGPHAAKLCASCGVMGASLFDTNLDPP